MLRDIHVLKSGQNPLHYPKQGILPTVRTVFFSQFFFQKVIRTKNKRKEKKKKNLHDESIQMQPTAGKILFPSRKD